eukprot:gene12153-13407_t
MGNAEVGKSCIIKRYCEKRFVSKYMATIGIDYGVTKVKSGERSLKVNIFDMAGHPFFYEVRNEFYKDTQGALLVYDVTRRDTFDALEGWLDELKTEVSNQREVDDIVFAVCANKTDTISSRKVNESEGRLWAESKGFLYFETSAQSGDGIQDMFKILFGAMVHTIEHGGKPKLGSMALGYTKEHIEAIRQLKNGKDNFDRLGLRPGATSDEVNKAYRRLAVLLHPDKSAAPGTEEAFKILANARSSILKL